MTAILTVLDEPLQLKQKHLYQWRVLCRSGASTRGDSILNVQTAIMIGYMSIYDRSVIKRDS